MSENQEKLNEQLFNVVADEKVSDEARLKKLKYLVRLGADVNARALGIGKSILVFAKESKDEEVVKFLQDKGAIEIYPTKEEALEVSQGFWDDKGDLKSLEEIKELIKKGADVNAKDENGWTALIEAARGGYLEVVKCLTDNGADAHQKDKYGWTALIEAARGGYLEVVKCLTDNWADVNAKDKYGWTALIKASENGHLEVVKCLTDNGVNMKVKDRDGWTARDRAKFGGKDDCQKFLEELQQKEKGNWKIWQRMFGGRD